MSVGAMSEAASGWHRGSPWARRDPVQPAPGGPSPHTQARSWLLGGTGQVSFLLSFPPQPLFSCRQPVGSTGQGLSRLGVCAVQPRPGWQDGSALPAQPCRPSLLGARQPVPLGGHRQSLLSNYSISGLRPCLIV